MGFRKKIKIIKHWELNKSKYFSIFVISIVFFFVYLALRNSTIILEAKDAFKDPGFVGIFGSLIGAIIGGTMSIFGAIYINNRQTKSKAFVVKMNITYKPLYDELVELRSVFEQNPYPNYFRFEKGPQTIIPHPQFNAWERIKSDSRYLFVPNFIKEEFNNLYNIIEKYLKSRREASDKIQAKINEILQKKYQTSCTIRNLGEVITNKVLVDDNGKGSIFTSYFEGALKPQVTLNEQQISELTIDIIHECNRLESAMMLKEDYQELIRKTDELIFGIGTIIEIINKNYEEKSSII